MRRQRKESGSSQSPSTDPVLKSARMENLDAIVQKLNSAPNFQLFEASSRHHTLEWPFEMKSLLVYRSAQKALCLVETFCSPKAPNATFYVPSKKSKPGKWSIFEKPREDPMDFVGILLRWVGPVDWDNLPEGLDFSPNNEEIEWKRVGSYSIDSGAHGLFDKDSLNELIELTESQDKEYVLEVLAEYAFDNVLSVKVGFASTSIKLWGTMEGIWSWQGYAKVKRLRFS
ncbi:hypothetical protein NLI96_g1209 [Meripilus lineatus]|uniref:Uncharacterized protein n=1 Tax=Meripilus lineatus TaxID=2056292 RepID=A0AAD5VAJ6_9APHY|nr:hypothetical protein NLI96_g1209 [Physisporinus lineatus]